MIEAGEYWIDRTRKEVLKGGKIMPVTNINVRVDSDVKSEAQEIFMSLGLDMGTAINIFLRQTIQRRGIPFITVTHGGKKPIPDCMKGKIWMSDDFDAPLEDFKEYME